jgi:hypothetical protein
MRFLPLLFCLLPIMSLGQIILDKEAFAKEFETAFSESIQGLESFKDTEPVLLSCNRADFEYEEDNGIWSLKMVFNCYSKDEAIRTKDMLANEVEKGLPAADFSRTKGYGAEYIDYLKWSFEFDSPKFAEKKKRPSVEIGVLKHGEDYRTVITLREPYFKKQYSPSWD